MEETDGLWSEPISSVIYLQTRPGRLLVWGVRVDRDVAGVGGDGREGCHGLLLSDGIETGAVLVIIVIRTVLGDLNVVAPKIA